MSSKEAAGSVRKSEFAYYESEPRATVATGRFFLTMKSAARTSTKSAVSLLWERNVGGTVDFVIAPERDLARYVLNFGHGPAI